MHHAIATLVRRATRETAAVATAIGLAALLGGSRPAAAAATVIQLGDTLSITGNRGDDSIWIIGVDGHAGIVTVKVDDLPMVAHHGLQHIHVDLRGGENFLAMYQVHLGGDVTITGGDGKNYLWLGRRFGKLHNYMPNLIWGSLSIAVGDGLNETVLENSWIIGDVEIDGSDGRNYVMLGNDSPLDLGAVVFGNLSVTTGAENDRIEIVKSWLGDTLIDTGADRDSVLLGMLLNESGANYEFIGGNVFVGTLSVAAGAGADNVKLADNAVYGDATMTLGDDDDSLLLLGPDVLDGLTFEYPPNEFHAALAADGGNGEDYLYDDPANVYAFEPEFDGFELP